MGYAPVNRAIIASALGADPVALPFLTAGRRSVAGAADLHLKIFIKLRERLPFLTSVPSRSSLALATGSCEYIH